MPKENLTDPGEDGMAQWMTDRNQANPDPGTDCGTPQSDVSEKKTKGRWSRAVLIEPVLLGSLGFCHLTCYPDSCVWRANHWSWQMRALLF